MVSKKPGQLQDQEGTQAQEWNFRLLPAPEQGLAQDDALPESTTPVGVKRALTTMRNELPDGRADEMSGGYTGLHPSWSGRTLIPGTGTRDLSSTTPPWKTGTLKEGMPEPGEHEAPPLVTHNQHARTRPRAPFPTRKGRRAHAWSRPRARGWGSAARGWARGRPGGWSKVHRIKV